MFFHEKLLKDITEMSFKLPRQKNLALQLFKEKVLITFKATVFSK